MNNEPSSTSDSLDEERHCSMVIDGDEIVVAGYESANGEHKASINRILEEAGIKIAELHISKDGDLRIPREGNITATLGRVIGYTNTKKQAEVPVKRYSTEISFDDVQRRAREFADMLDRKREVIIQILLRYETYEAADDELQRTTDLLRNLSENAQYFQREVGPIASFLPSNQPLYAFTCFAIIPSLMAERVFTKVPRGMSHFFCDLMDSIELNAHFSNIEQDDGRREEFIDRHTQTQYDGRTTEFDTAVDAVIFTGSTENSVEMRRKFHRRVMMIVNGSGHNPLIVTPQADIHGAVRSSLRVQLYNQGQDCAGPNSILVHQDVYARYIEKLVAGVKEVKVGPYEDRETRVGPISKRGDLARIQGIIQDNAGFLNPSTEGVIRVGSGIVEPTIIEKPLSEGGNLRESFAPVFFIQQYENDDQLEEYFQHPRYRNNAMYITVYGHSPYVDSLIGDPDDKKLLHNSATIIRNTDLHAPGVERGVKPYGGYGKGASNVSSGGILTPKPTLPQRDIYEHLVAPSIKKHG